MKAKKNSVLIIFWITPSINVHTWTNHRFIDNDNNMLTENLTTTVGLKMQI
jgi:hypothetical protein